MVAKSPVLLPLFPALQLASEENAETLSAPSTHESWLCLYFPKLALESVYPDTALRPCVVAAVRAGRTVIQTASRDAEAFGIGSGMPLAACLALYAQLDVRAYDPVAQQSYLERLAKWASQFSSFVSLQEPQALLLEIGGSLRLFGGVENLLARIRLALSKTRSMQVYAAVAPVPAASFLLAKAGCERIVTDKPALRSMLGDLRVEHLSCSVKVKQQLGRAGLCYLRDLWRLPLSSLARRFGKGFADELSRSLGNIAEPRTAFQTLPPFQTEYPFVYPVYDRAFLQAAVDVLNAAFERFLRLHDLAVNQCDYLLYGQRALLKTIVVGVRTADRDAQRFSKLFGEQLHDLRLTEPVANIHLFAKQFAPFTSRSEDLPLLFDDLSHAAGVFVSSSATQQAANRLFEQLQARFGRDKIKGIALVGDHRPEEAYRYTEFDDNIKQAPIRRRPLWLLAEPELIANKHDVPWYQGPLCIKQGPERIESGWWSGQDMGRDYYVASDNYGRRLWLYRELGAGHRWYLHGFFA